MSLLSFLDHLSGKAKPYKTVSAKAVEDTKVIKLPFGAFKLAFEKYPDTYLRVVQIVMIRLQVKQELIRWFFFSAVLIFFFASLIFSFGF